MFLAHIALSGSLIVSSLWHWSGVLQMIVEKDTVMIQMCGSTIPCRLNNTPILSMLLVFLLGGVENNFQIQLC